MRSLAWLPLLLLGCGDSPLCVQCGKRDMAVAPAPDLASAPDLAAPPDLAPPIDLAQRPDFAGLTFCADTTVAGTCAQAFFQPVSVCFAPMGACTTMGDGQTYGNLCWANGNKLLAT